VEADPSSVLAVFIGHSVHSAAPLVSLYEPVGEWASMV
jgi:hypothetical protein